MLWNEFALDDPHGEKSGPKLLKSAGCTIEGIP